MADLRIKIAGIEFKNPVMTCSGTFGSGIEYSEYIDLNLLGAVVTKGVSDVPWPGNLAPRIAETRSGMLNAVGLQNPGVDTFLETDLEYLKKYDTVKIVNVCGHSIEEYLNVVRKLNDSVCDMYEINISCPNVSAGGMALGTDPAMVHKITSEIKKISKKPVIMKLSPNVTDIREIAKAAEAGGADALSMINTITGMKINVEKQTFALANRTGGLSGPAIHPVAVRMVYEASQVVSIPIIGMGGVTSWQDAVEMILAGASAVAVGTATFSNPSASLDIIKGIGKYMDRKGINRVSDMVGIVE